MRFRIEVDLTRVAGDETEELSRILRYWAGNLKHYPMDQPHTESLRDSAYEEVGSWTLS